MEKCFISWVRCGSKLASPSNINFSFYPCSDVSSSRVLWDFSVKLIVCELWVLWNISVFLNKYKPYQFSFGCVQTIDKDQAKGRYLVGLRFCNAMVNPCLEEMVAVVIEVYGGRFFTSQQTENNCLHSILLSISFSFHFSVQNTCLPSG